MEKERINFEFRYEMSLKRKITAACFWRKMSVSRLVEESLVRAMRLHEEGHLLFTEKSGFRERLFIEDKTVVQLTVTKKYKEMARVLGFIYKRSQAEVMRVALEVCLGLWAGENRVLKNYYNREQFRVQEVHISLLWPYPHIQIYTSPAFQSGASREGPPFHEKMIS